MEAFAYLQFTLWYEANLPSPQLLSSELTHPTINDIACCTSQRFDSKSATNAQTTELIICPMMP
jgi:hypothetical protein